ncbi:COG1683: Uncharacterized conserved protein / FIG143828: Hypothetical protein YbgA [hydrothermal vent metagenome]|uniref:Uncharacterized protein n=1 Tax=hydrothermal vent metagenome TaxID=652676 RepID=A0A3B0ZAF6_9ZZZZ
MRYDGKHKRNVCVTERLSKHFDWFPVCPEVAIGLGVPRPPVHLVESYDNIHALGVEDAAINVTRALQAYASQCVDQLDDVSGYVFKSRSPSCGPGDTDLFNVEGEVIGKTSGIFAAVVHDLLPTLPLIDEMRLEDPAACEAFIQQVKDYQSAMRGSV